MRAGILSLVLDYGELYALLKLAADDVGEDLEVLVTVQTEAFPLRDAVLVDDAQGTPAFVFWGIEPVKDNS